MKKYLIAFILFQLNCVDSNAQKYITTNATVHFFSKTPLEDIYATNTTVASLINTSTDSVFVKIKNTAFVFKNSLMQEHFNENYMESEKYPYDEFHGKISTKINFTKDGNYPVEAVGILKIHGIEKPATIKGIISIKEDGLYLSAEMVTHTADYNIKIPKFIFEKIAQEIKVTMQADYKLIK